MIVVIVGQSCRYFYIPERTKLHEKSQNFSYKLGIFLGNLGKKEDILDWEWSLISDPGDGEKRPCAAIEYMAYFRTILYLLVKKTYVIDTILLIKETIFFMSTYNLPYSI